MPLTKLQPLNLDTTANYTFNQVTVSSSVDLTGASNVSLGNIGNVKITGGTSGQYLVTDGSGNLSFTTLNVSSSSISNGNSNVNIPAANGNVNISSAGNANVVVVTGTGVNVAGTLNTTGNLTASSITTGSGSGGDITGGNLISANYLTGTLTTGAQPNITSVGLLTSLSVGPNSSIILTGTSGFVRANSIQGTDGVAALYPAYGGVTGAVGVTSNLTVGTSAAGNITANGNVSAGYFIGNGSSLSSINGANVTGQVANALVAGTVTTAAQPNITSVGTLTGLTSNGTINFTNASNVSLGAVSNVKITGGTANYVLQTDGAGNLSWVAQTAGGGGSPQPGTDFNTSITVSNNYAVTATMANAAVFANNAVVYSMYVTNIDSTGATGASISANFRYANGTTLSIANQIPVPYRGAVELLKQPKYFASGDAIQLQGLNNGTGASSFFHASITYGTTADATYQYSVTNIASSGVATNVYTSTSNASVVQSVMLTNSSNLGNIPVTVTISSSGNVIQGYLSSALLLPVNSTIELCEQPRNMDAGSVIQVTAGAANTVTVTVAAKKI